MAERRKKEVETPKTRRRPATTPQARENRMVSLAIDLAERQLVEGTASSQVIAHYIKLGSSREHLEQERLKGENTLLAAKAEAMQSAKRIEELYEKALGAMKSYSGSPVESSDNDEEY